jgi:RND family efflux transporter MFP subunit
MMVARRIAVVVLSIWAVAAFVGSAGDALAQKAGKKGKFAARVGVDKVIKEPVSQTMPVIGRFVARQHGPVGALISGPVDQVLVDVGDRVVKGQVIARLHMNRIRATRDFKAAELLEKQAALATAKAQLNLAEGELTRLDRLRLSAAYSKARRTDKQNEVVKFNSEVAEAQAGIGQAEANLELAQIDLGNAEIRAPYDAVVAQRHVVAGNYVRVGDKIVTLINDTVLEVEADVPSNRLMGLQDGRTVRIKLDDARTYDATVRAVIPTENVMTRTRPVRFVPQFGAASKSTGLAADQSVTVEIPISDPRDAVTLHKDAVISRNAVNFVFVVVGDTVEKRTVRLGRAIGERFEVLDGLMPDDLVVVKGNERLRPGQKVTFDGVGASKKDGSGDAKPVRAPSKPLKAG